MADRMCTIAILSAQPILAILTEPSQIRGRATALPWPMVNARGFCLRNV